MANSKSGGRSGAHSAPPPKSPPPNPGRNAHPGARMGHQDAPRYDPTRKRGSARKTELSALSDRLQQKGAATVILILDACRDNPFAVKGKRAIGMTRGLTRMDPAEGMFVLFSAGQGQSALDRLSDTDANPNSVFTRTLLVEMETPASRWCRSPRRRKARCASSRRRSIMSRFRPITTRSSAIFICRQRERRARETWQSLKKAAARACCRRKSRRSRHCRRHSL